MNSAQVGVLEETNKVCLRSLLEGKDSMALETQIDINLEVLCNFPNKPLEGQLPDQKLSTLLVLANLTGNSSRAVTVGLLNSSSGGSRLTSSLHRDAASWEPFLLWTYERSAWYGPS
ncbi:hypothetical protein EE612_017820, partial [Oryza sativa]